MQILFKNKIFLFFLLSAMLFVTLSIIGGIRNYSPIPFGDMWDGWLGFYLKILSGDWSAWWAQHNEHRIVLARILFWMDFAWFNGDIKFLIIINYLLVTLSCVAFGLFLKPKDKTASTFFLFLIAWLFLWSQKENLTWGFQSQFFLAQLLPLFAFYFLHRANTGKFIISCLFGIASIGAMANGVLALPLMTLYAILIRQSRLRVMTLLLLSIATIILYFYHYHQPIQHSSPVHILLTHPLDMLRYILLYMGGPFAHIIVSDTLAYLAGLVFMIGVIYFCFRILNLSSSHQLGLLFFIFYIAATAAASASGRLLFGVDQALSSRYSTPSVMAWAALFTLYFPLFATKIKKYGNKAWMPLMIFVIFLLPGQYRALKNQDDILFNKNVAGLAVALGINDQAQITKIYPSSFIPLSLANEAYRKKIRFVGALSDVRNEIDKVHPNPLNYSTKKTITSPIENEQRFVKIQGSLTGPAPKIIYFINSQHRVVGIAIKKNHSFVGYSLSP